MGPSCPTGSDRIVTNFKIAIFGTHRHARCSGFGQIVGGRRTADGHALGHAVARQDAGRLKGVAQLHGQARQQAARRVGNHAQVRL